MRSVIAFAAVLLAVSNSHEAAGQSAGSPPVLTLTVGKSLVIDSPLKIRQVATASGEIVESVGIGPKELLLNGKSPGETSVTIWLEDETHLTYDVVVQENPSKWNAVREQIERELPGSDVTITPVNGTAFVRGVVADLDAAERVMNIVSTVAKGVNLLRVAAPSAERQVLLQVRFASVDRSAANTLGLNLAGGAFNQKSAIGTGSVMSQTGGPPFSLSQAANIFLFRPDLNIAAAIQALENRNLLQVLAEPNLLTVDNTAASFVAGGEFPFPIVQPGAGANSITIAFKEYGIRLGFLPRITPAGTIRLQVAPEVSALDYANSVTVAGTTVPGTSIRKVQTEVELPSGQSFVIAGLLDRQTTESFSKIPGIGDIPVLGKLFQSRSITRNNSELLVIITPTIVSLPNSSQEVPALTFPAGFLPADLPAAQPPRNGDKAAPVPVTPRGPIPVEDVIEFKKRSTAPASAPADMGRNGPRMDAR